MLSERFDAAHDLIVDDGNDIKVINGDEEDQLRLHQNQFHISQATLQQTIDVVNAWKILSMFAQKAHASFSSLPGCHENVQGFAEWMMQDLQKIEERIQQNPPRKQQPQQQQQKHEHQQQEHEHDHQQHQEQEKRARTSRR